MAFEQTDRQHVDQRFEDLKSERSSWLQHWRELSEFIQPRIGRFMLTGNNKGGKKNGKIINSTATFALRVLASGLMTGLTSPARPWFKLGLGDSRLDDVRSNRLWLDEVEKILLSIFRKSNAYQSLYSAYEEIGLGGTAAMFIEANSQTVINARTFTIGEYSLAIGPDGRVNTFYREFRKTVDQIVREYGINNVTASTRNLWERGQLDAWRCIRQAIEPNPKSVKGSLAAGDKPWRSWHWEVSATKGGPGDGFLRKSGFDDFPIMGARWDVRPSDVYGRSPAMDILGDVKQLQMEERQKAKGIAKLVDPPMAGDPNIDPTQVSTAPGGFTSTPNIGGQRSFQPAYQVDPRIGELMADINEVEERIREGMFVNLFLAISSIEDVRSATEVIERKEEKLLMLGPTIERLQVELLDPLIDRTFNIANRMGMIPPPPEDIQGRDLDIEYVSPLAQAQRAVSTGTIQRLLVFTEGVAGINPAALDKIDADEAVNEFATAVGASPKLIRSQDDVEEIREQRAIKAQQERAVGAASGLVDSAKTLSESGAAGQDMVDNILNQVTPS